jgi:hypothetical protein
MRVTWENEHSLHFQSMETVSSPCSVRFDRLIFPLSQEGHGRTGR